MKRFNLGGLVLSLALAAGMLCLSPALRAQNTPQDQPQTQPQTTPATPQDQGQAGQQGQMGQSAQTFTGKIAKSGGKYVLKEAATNTEYKLDDQQKAASFEGQSVKVTGTLNAQNNTIHVADIQPASPGA